MMAHTSGKSTGVAGVLGVSFDLQKMLSAIETRVTPLIEELTQCCKGSQQGRALLQP